MGTLVVEENPKYTQGRLREREFPIRRRPGRHERKRTLLLLVVQLLSSFGLWIVRIEVEIAASRCRRTI